LEVHPYFILEDFAHRKFMLYNTLLYIFRGPKYPAWQDDF